jgi:ATP synthase protein I
MAETDQDRKARLEALDAKLAEKREPDEQMRHQDEHHAQVHAGWRMVIELVAGLGIGFGMGYGLDVLFGTLPIFLIVFTLLGFAAGIKTMMRTAKEMAPGEPGEDERD